MKNNFFNKSIGNINSRPFLNSEVTSQILYGEKFKILSKSKGWVKLKLNTIIILVLLRVKNFLKNLNRRIKFVNSSQEYLKKKGNKFFQTKNFLYFGFRISVTNKSKEFFEFEKNKWVKIIDTKKINHSENNLVKILKLFLNVKYLWGGKSSEGIDCSALIQIFFYYNRIFFFLEIQKTN